VRVSSKEKEEDAKETPSHGRAEGMMTRSLSKRASSPPSSLFRPTLCAELVYADTLCATPREIFKVYDSKDMSDAEDEAVFSCRINDVSRNHRNRAFRVKITAVSPSGIEPVFTSPIIVKSKRTRSKKKTSLIGKKRSRHREEKTSLHKRSKGGRDAWREDSLAMLRKLQWITIGYETTCSNDASSTSSCCGMDRTRPIVQCPECQSVFRYGQGRRHKPSCGLRYLLEDAEEAEEADNVEDTLRSSDEDDVSAYGSPQSVLDVNDPAFFPEADVSPLGSPLSTTSNEGDDDDSDLWEASLFRDIDAVDLFV